jgi:glycerol-3-phosphate O-acyltransferase
VNNSLTLNDVDHHIPRKDISFVPVTINYDRVYEGQSFPMELLGEAKQKEGLIRSLKSWRYLDRPLGRVNIRYCKPISLLDYTATYAKEHNSTIDHYFQNPEAK